MRPASAFRILINLEFITLAVIGKPEPKRYI